MINSHTHTCRSIVVSIDGTATTNLFLIQQQKFPSYIITYGTTGTKYEKTPYLKHTQTHNWFMELFIFNRDWSANQLDMIYMNNITLDKYCYLLLASIFIKYTTHLIPVDTGSHVEDPFDSWWIWLLDKDSKFLYQKIELVNEYKY